MNLSWLCSCGCYCRWMQTMEAVVVVWACFQVCGTQGGQLSWTSLVCGHALSLRQGGAAGSCRLSTLRIYDTSFHFEEQFVFVQTDWCNKWYTHGDIQRERNHTSSVCRLNVKSYIKYLQGLLTFSHEIYSIINLWMEYLCVHVFLYFLC